MESETQLSDIILLRKAHPLSHFIDDVLISVNSSEFTLDPVAIVSSVITTRISVVSLFVRHGLGARLALVTLAVGAVTLSIGESSGTIVHERVRGQHSLNLPLTISS
jgi:hypothetical protein